VPQRESHLHGLLVVDKPGLELAEPTHIPSAYPTESRRLPTSHDIVQQVRRWSGQRRIGHTGTLDPLASGVLVLCLGQATRLVEYYQGHRKQYYAEISLGAATDTYDALGQITATAPLPSLNATNIAAILQQFRGPVLQSPPVYSAIKQGGESVHRKARRGETVVLESRPVMFYQLELLAVPAPDRFSLRVVCSAGAYIRSLAHDLGLALGTYAHLRGLRREAAGPFTLQAAHTLAEIEQAAQQERLGDLLLPPGYGLHMPLVKLAPDAIRRLGFGQQVVLPQAPIAPEGTSEDTGEREPRLAQALDPQDRFIGILRYLGPAAGDGFLWKAEKWFERDA
jgi:tRNA pseudouridine55 synthase